MQKPSGERRPPIIETEEISQEGLEAFRHALEGQEQEEIGGDELAQALFNPEKLGIQQSKEAIASAVDQELTKREQDPRLSREVMVMVSSRADAVKERVAWAEHDFIYRQKQIRASLELLTKCGDRIDKGKDTQAYQTFQRIYQEVIDSWDAKIFEKGSEAQETLVKLMDIYTRCWGPTNNSENTHPENIDLRAVDQIIADLDRLSAALSQVTRELETKVIAAQANRGKGEKIARQAFFLDDTVTKELEFLNKRAALMQIDAMTFAIQRDTVRDWTESYVADREAQEANAERTPADDIEQSPEFYESHERIIEEFQHRAKLREQWQAMSVGHDGLVSRMRIELMDIQERQADLDTKLSAEDQEMMTAAKKYAMEVLEQRAFQKFAEMKEKEGVVMTYDDAIGSSEFQQFVKNNIEDFPNVDTMPIITSGALNVLNHAFERAEKAEDAEVEPLEKVSRDRFAAVKMSLVAAQYLEMVDIDMVVGTGTVRGKRNEYPDLVAANTLTHLARLAAKESNVPDAVYHDQVMRANEAIKAMIGSSYLLEVTDPDQTYAHKVELGERVELIDLADPKTEVWIDGVDQPDSAKKRVPKQDLLRMPTLSNIDVALASTLT